MGREILKASTARTDAWVAVLGPSNLVRVDWSPVDERLYYPGVRVAHWTWFGDGAQTISTQFQNGNRCYVYRNYGMPAATAVIWPRNYPDVETRDPGLFPAQRYPAYYTLVAKTEIERGAAFLVQDIAEDDETVISAADQEYAVMQVWPGVLKLD
jgi:hypothetical protein